MAIAVVSGLVETWSASWPGGPTAASVSVLDVLVGDAIEEETGARPDGPLVAIDGVDTHAIRRWTGAGGGLFARVFGGQRALLRRLEKDAARAPERVAAWGHVVEELGEIPWTTIAPMEVVSLAMGHFGPARQHVALPVIASFLAGTAASIASRSPDVRATAARSLLRYAPAFGEIARTSARAFEEMGRRARERGHAVPDPFALRIPAYLPLLG